MTIEQPQPDIDIGACLAERRKQTGRSLEEVAEQTRIRRVYLESLEANRFQDLPGRAYVVGFLKVYARDLGIDVEPLLASLDDQKVVKPLAALPVMSLPRMTRTVAPLRSVSIFLIGLVVVLLAGGLAFFLPDWLAPQSPPPVLPLAKALPVEEQGPAEPVVQESAAVVPPVEPALAVGAAPPGEPVSDPIPDQTLAAPQEQEEPLPAIADKGSSLRMLAIAKGTLVIQVDDRPSQRYVLREGLDLTWPVKRDVSAELGGPGQVRFWLDRAELPLGARTTFHLQKLQEN